jgi:hypothetical protein
MLVMYYVISYARIFYEKIRNYKITYNHEK